MQKLNIVAKLDLWTLVPLGYSPCHSQLIHNQIMYKVTRDSFGRKYLIMEGLARTINICPDMSGPRQLVGKSPSRGHGQPDQR